MLANHRFKPGVCLECGRREEDPTHTEVCDDALEAAYAELAKTWGDD